MLSGKIRAYVAFSFSRYKTVLTGILNEGILLICPSTRDDGNRRESTSREHAAHFLITKLIKDPRRASFLSSAIIRKLETGRFGPAIYYLCIWVVARDTGTGRLAVRDRFGSTMAKQKFLRKYHEDRYLRKDWIN